MLGVQPTPPPPAAADDDSDEPPPEPVAASADLLGEVDDLLGPAPPAVGPKSHKESLEMFFKEHKPENLDKIDKLLSGYAGREETLYDKLADKYSVRPVWPEGIPRNEKPAAKVATPKSKVGRSRASSKAASPAADK